MIKNMKYIFATFCWLYDNPTHERQSNTCAYIPTHMRHTHTRR